MTKNKIKIFFDMEYSGLHKLTTAISIGLVAEDGRKYYAEFTDFDKYQIDEFLKSQVLPKRTLSEYDFERDYDADSKTVLVKGDSDLVRDTLLAWIRAYEEQGVEMWGDLLAYDWVLFINIFGNGLAIPSFIDYIPMDLCTALNLMGEDKGVDRDVFAYGEDGAKARLPLKHNALHDAETQLEVFKRLIEKVQGKKTEESEGEDVGEELTDDTAKEYKDEAEEAVKLKAEKEAKLAENNGEKNPPKRGRGRPPKDYKIEGEKKK
tara:strand:+ start:5200 stop:5991 length:792 start_codon:yes stop_codon:yes gene_type:complete